MAWPTDPIDLTEIPSMQYENPFMDEALYLGPAAVKALCRVVVAHQPLLEKVTAGDTGKEATVGSALIAAINRGSRLPDSALAGDASRKVIAVFDSQLQEVIGSDPERKGRIVQVLRSAAWSGCVLAKSEVMLVND